jgi:hypothetical protein
MKNPIKLRIAAPALLLIGGAVSYGQAIPAGGASMTSSSGGPNFSALDGVLHYALSGSEIVQLGYYGSGEVTHSTALTGDVAYTAKSTTYPFSVLGAGGVLLGNLGPQGTTYYLNTAVSQGLETRHWVFNISDSFSYLPQSPTLGLSGIPGVGDQGAVPVQGPVVGPAGGILTNSGNRIANSLAGNVERQINHNTSVSGSGSWEVLHFLDETPTTGGYDSAQVAGTVALNRRIDARSSVSVNAVYSTLTYSGNISASMYPDIETRGVNVLYQRLLSRDLSINLSAGPQWVSSSNSLVVPSSLNAAGSASLTYSRKLTNAAVNYSHGVNAGSGVLPGALSDSIYGSVGHTYGRLWVASVNGSYTRSSGLAVLSNGNPLVPVHAVYDTVYGGVQLTRAFGEHFSGYVSYGIQNQSSNKALAAQNAFSGTANTFGIGVTFTPRSTRLGQF